MLTQGEPPITVRGWTKVLVFGGVTAAALIVVLGVILPFLVLDTPHGLGVHPLLAHNPGSSPGKDDTYGRTVAALLAWLGGTYVGIRAAGIHGPRERSLAALCLAGVVAVLFAADVLLVDAARARDAEPPPARTLPSMVGERTPLPSCGEDKLQPNGDPISIAKHRCLLDAFDAGETAEFVIYRADGEPTEQIIRVLADSTIEVFAHTGHEDRAGWQRYSCTALRPASPPRIFELVGCDKAVDIT